MADIKRRNGGHTGLSLDAAVNARIARKQQQEDADKNHNPADWGTGLAVAPVAHPVQHSAAPQQANPYGDYPPEPGNVPDEDMLLAAMDTALGQVTAGVQQSEVHRTEDVVQGWMSEMQDADMTAESMESVVHSGFPKSLADKQRENQAGSVEEKKEEVKSEAVSQPVGVVLPAPVVDDTTSKQQMQHMVQELTDASTAVLSPLERIRQARKMYLETTPDAEELNDGSLSAGQRSSVKNLPKAMILSMMQEFDNQSKNQSDAVVAWVMCHAPADMVEKLAPFLTTDQMDLIALWQELPSGSLEQRVQSLDKQARQMRKSMDTANMMLAYLVAKGLDSPCQSKDIEFLQDSMMDVLVRAEEQTKTVVTQKGYRTGRPKRK